MKFKALSVLVFAEMFISIMMPAQNLPALKTSSEYKVGQLQKGVDYYLVTNTYERGFADFALVQKGSQGVEEARKCLDSLPTLFNRRPFDILADNGIGLRRSGYIETRDDATIFHFDNVPVYDSQVTDSVLLIVFNIINQSLCEQAIVISGDINTTALMNKLSIFAMMIRQRTQFNPVKGYKWLPFKDPRFSFNRTSGTLSASVSATYDSPRTPVEYMNTAQPLISSLFAQELGGILQKRIIKNCLSANIPFGSVEFHILNSSQTSGNERYTITVYTDNAHLEAATSILASNLSSIDTYGVLLEEYVDAKDEALGSLLKIGGKVIITNEEYTRSCIASFLYGSSLASVQQTAQFIATRDIPDTTECRFFNNFSDALLDKSANLTLSYSGLQDTLTRSHAMNVFNAAWDYQVANPEVSSYVMNYGDTLGLAEPGIKVKIRDTRPDVVSGGQLWEFSNGISVIYKKVSTSGIFNYALLIRGGYPYVPDLENGEGAFVSDMLKLYDVGGLKGSDFQNMLMANGIVMNVTSTLSDLRITGSAPSGKLQLLLKSLVSMSGKRTLNMNSFHTYKANEMLRLDREQTLEHGIEAKMWNVIYPNYKYLPYKIARNLTDSLAIKADKYFDDEFAKVNDGVIVLIGDLNEEKVKKLLCNYLGSFRCESNYSTPPSVRYQPRSGWSTYTVAGEPKSLNMLMTMALPYTSDNYMASKIAVMALRTQLAKELSLAGMSFEVKDVFDAYPQERFSVMITCAPVDSLGLASGMQTPDPLLAVSALRAAVSDAAGKGLTGDELNAYKSLLSNMVAVKLANPEHLVDVTLVRYSERKDLVTRYADKINAVSPDRVKYILTALNAGSKVEYVVK